MLLATKTRHQVKAAPFSSQAICQQIWSVRKLQSELVEDAVECHRVESFAGSSESDEFVRP